jgi:hypothetical protein
LRQNPITYGAHASSNFMSEIKLKILFLRFSNKIEMSYLGLCTKGRKWCLMKFVRTRWKFLMSMSRLQTLEMKRKIMSRRKFHIKIKILKLELNPWEKKRVFNNSILILAPLQLVLNPIMENIFCIHRHFYGIFVYVHARLSIYF